MEYPVFTFHYQTDFQENNFYNFILKHNTRASTSTVLTLIAEIGRHFNFFETNVDNLQVDKNFETYTFG